ncbi:MAG: hypothetical protein IIB28_05575 [Chloroflexi bacterium]|nr:hypothetical protein [Chloroflexota bacterium]
MRIFLSNRPERQHGITGLETAIILIAFVVVASVFAFTVLSTGIFASERSKETVFSGIQEAQSTLEPRGSLIAYAGKIGATSTLFKMTFLLSNAIAGEPVDLTPAYSTDGSDDDPDTIAGAKQVTVISYRDKNQFLPDIPWTISWPGEDDGDNLLENNEKAEVTVWILTRDNTVTNVNSDSSVKVLTNGISSDSIVLATNDEFTLEVKPASGAVLNIRRVLPSQFDTVMDLN